MVFRRYLWLNSFHIAACEGAGVWFTQGCHLPAGLFTWAIQRPITKEQAMRCAKREPGRSWEALDTELQRLSEQNSFYS